MGKKSKGRANVTLVPQAETPNVQAELAKQVEAAPAETVSAENVSAPVVEAKKPAKARYVSGRFAPGQVIRLKVAANPKRRTGASYGRFDLHKDGQTVAEYVQACVDNGWKAAKAHDDVRWDAAHGFIEVEAPAPKAE